jgi:hypothetical protein
MTITFITKSGTRVAEPYDLYAVSTTPTPTIPVLYSKPKCLSLPKKLSVVIFIHLILHSLRSCKCVKIIMVRPVSVPEGAAPLPGLNWPCSPQPAKKTSFKTK